MTDDLPEMFPRSREETSLDNLKAIRKSLIGASEKADDALTKAEAKSASCHLQVMWMNEAVEQAEAALKRAKGIISYEVDVGTGEIQP